jgi:hypothetical protein
MGYEYVLDVLSTDPTSMGAMSMSASGSATGPAPSTTYNLHMRTWCSMSSMSTWATFGPITTSACMVCNAPTGIAITPAPHTVTITWGTVTGAMNYEYVVSNTVTDPTTPGTTSMTTTATKTGLTPLTTYYVHTRTQCGTGTWSPWSTGQSFVTSSAAALSNVNGNNHFALSAYPNPFDNAFTLEVSGGSIHGATVEILDVNGRLQDTFSLTEYTKTVDLKMCPAGLYFIKYRDEFNAETIKVIKQ